VSQAAAVRGEASFSRPFMVPEICWVILPQNRRRIIAPMHAAGVMLGASRSVTRKRLLLREKDLMETLA
jgi:hypothetical protein